MKGLKKVALASAIAAVSAGAQAELKALDDSAMSELTGQAGISIDVETKYTIGEFVYQDAGNLVLQGLSLGGNTNDSFDTGYLDNFRLYIDVAGAGAIDPTNGSPDNELVYGFAEVIGLATMLGLQGNSDGDIINGADPALGSGQPVPVNADGHIIDRKKVYGDGDLVIHKGFTDAFEKGGGYQAFANSTGRAYADLAAGPGTLSFANVDYATIIDIGTRAVDFNFSIDLIGLADSTYVIGSQAVEKTNHTTGTDATANTTALISDLSMSGYLGPADIHIENNGNGFSGGQLNGGVGTGAADSKINWDSFFKITDLDLYIDIAGVQLSDIRIHNERGDLTSMNQEFTVDGTGTPVLENTSSFGFAHSKRQIFAVKDDVINVTNVLAAGPGGDTNLAYEDGIALNTRFKGDIDIGALSFGDTGKSIGSLYFTDIQSTTNWTISAH